MAQIELRIDRLEQLFDSLDPAPFHAKALDPNADAYLRESAGEHASLHDLSISIHGPAALENSLNDIASGIHAHYTLVSQQAERRHRRRRRVGRIALISGSIILMLALFLRSWIKTIGGSVGEVMAEGLLILAWVALWRPIETIGVDSWESREERRLLSALSKVPVRFVELKPVM
jgi:hypothetical protein